MRARNRSGITRTGGLFVAAAGFAATALAAGVPSIAGSYGLVKRVLPDGTVLTPPVVVGLMTYTKEYRNFNVGWTDKTGKHASISLVVRYDLTPTKYCEHPVFFLDNNVGIEGMSYEAPKEKGAECSAVTVKGSSVSFAIKGEPVVLDFNGDRVTATAKGLFTDYWQRVR
jgi:hypothetical protein